MSDSDDDLPISELIKKRKLAAKTDNEKVKAKASKSTKVEEKKVPAKIPSSSHNNDSTSRSLSTR